MKPYVKVGDIVRIWTPGGVEHLVRVEAMYADRLAGLRMTMNASDNGYSPVGEDTVIEVAFDYIVSVEHRQQVDGSTSMNRIVAGEKAAAASSAGTKPTTGA